MNLKCLANVTSLSLANVSSILPPMLDGPHTSERGQNTNWGGQFKGIFSNYILVQWANIGENWKNGMLYIRNQWDGVLFSWQWRVGLAEKTKMGLNHDWHCLADCVDKEGVGYIVVYWHLQVLLCWELHLRFCLVLLLGMLRQVWCR